MMRFLMAAVLCVVMTVPPVTQTADNEPASRDDVILYLRTIRSHDMMQRTLEAMLKPVHQMFHEQFEKDKNKLPVDFEARMNKSMDELLKDMPFDEMTQAMVPVYQKHFTKGDIEALNTFYSSPVGQKVLEEMHAVTGDSMNAIMPLMIRYMSDQKQRMQEEVKGMEKDATKPSD